MEYSTFQSEANRFNGTHAGNHSDGNSGNHSTIKKLIAHVVLEKSLELRSSNMLLGAFNVAAALLMIASIIFDAWRAEKKLTRVTLEPR